MLLGQVTPCDSTLWEKSLSKVYGTIDDKTLLSLAGGEHEQTILFKEFFSWLLKGGSKFPNLYLHFYSESYRAINAKRDIAEDSDILFVPHELIMTSEIARASEIGRAITRSGATLRSRHSFLATYLLAERANPNSYWKPYLDILPQTYETIPLFFEDGLLAELEGSMAMEKIRDRHESLRMEYSNIVEKVPQMAQFSYESFVWARLVVITRIFGMVIDGQKTEGLVPMADMLNHKRPRQTKWTYVANKRGFVITTLMSIGRNEEVFDSYGRKCNSRFFVNYGFVPEHNEDNEAILTFAMDNQDDLYTRKARLTNIPPEQAFQIPIQYEDLNNKVKQAFSYARFLAANASELTRLEKRHQSKLRLQEVPPISIENETKSLNLFSAAASASLALFPHELEHDLKLLADETRYPFFSNQRNIVLMRSGEKQVLSYYIELHKRIAPALEKLTAGEENVQPDLSDLPSYLPKSSATHMLEYFKIVVARLTKRT